MAIARPWTSLVRYIARRAGHYGVVTGALRPVGKCVNLGSRMQGNDCLSQPAPGKGPGGTGNTALLQFDAFTREQA